MNKTITIITGSPRKNGNTRILTDIFYNAVKDSNTVHYFHAADMQIGACKACDACYKNGKPCVFSDDFNLIMNAIIESDIVVFASPIYWYNFSSQMKMVIDKIYSSTSKDLSGKESILITVGADDDVRGFDATVLTYEQCIKLLGWKPLKQFVIPSVLEAGAILKTNHIHEVGLFAKSLA